MADLNDIAVFVRVAQFESFSRAAHALGMPVSTVSRKVAALEERIGVTLLQRTTRKLSLTAQGRAYYNQCSEPLGHLFYAARTHTVRGLAAAISAGISRLPLRARRPRAASDQNALLITPPSTRTAAPVVAEANGLAR